VTHRRAVLGLMVVTLVWGASFTVVKGALAGITPMLFVGIRFALALLLIAPAMRGITREELRAGALLGLLFWGGFVFQTIGIVHTTPSRSAFITALSTPLVPLVAWAAVRQRPHPAILIGIACASIGVYLLTDPGTGGPNYGDILTLGCAAFFAGHIVATGTLGRAGAALRILGVQFAVTSALAFAASPFTETPAATPTGALALAIAFLAVSGVGTFWFQLRAQRVLAPGETALIFALEPLFASLTSWVVLSEVLTLTQWIGGMLVLAAVLLAALRRSPRALQAA
jgi:drug/metabolite transporter (DMT)-like permease